MRSYFDPTGTLVLDDVTLDDLDAVLDLMDDRTPVMILEPAASRDGPLLAREDLDRLQVGVDRCTLALVILIVVIGLINLGRFVGAGA